MASPQLPTQARIGYGLSVAIMSDASPPTYVELEEVTNVTPPNQQVDQVEATHMQSPDRTREFISGLTSPGEASIEMNYVAGSTTDQRLQALKSAGTAKGARITFPNGVTWDFLCIVTGIEVATPVDDRMTCTATLTVSGETVITVPSPWVP